MKVDDVSSMILLFSTLNCLYWVITGLTFHDKPDPLVYGINSAALGINITNSIVYLHYRYEKKFIKTIALALGILSLISL